MVTYNVGLPYLLQGRVSKSSKTNEQDFFRTKLFRDSKHQIWKAASSSKWDLLPLEKEISADTLLEFHINDFCNSFQKDFTPLSVLKWRCISIEKPFNLPDWLQMYWFPNISSRFQPPSAIETRIFAKHDCHGYLRPVLGDFLDLLLLLQKKANGQSEFSLTLNNRLDTTDTNNSTSFIFSTGPAQHFHIHKRFFYPEDLARINNYISMVSTKYNTDDITGLIIKVYLTRYKKQPCFALVKGDAAFDNKNLEWRYLFRKDSTRLAHRITPNSDWIIDLDEDEIVPGFPSRIYVDMKGYVRDQTATEVQIIKWDYGDQIQNHVQAMPVSTHSFEPINRTMKELVESILNWKAGDRLRIKRVLGKVGIHPSLPCLTNESVTVFVDVNTLQLTPVNEDGLIFLADGCGVRIRRQAKWEQYTGLSSVDGIIEGNEPPYQAETTRESVGIITSTPKPGGGHRGSEQGNRFAVYWLTGNRVSGNGWVQLNVPAHQRLFPGTRIEGHIQNKKGHFRVSTLRIFADAIWRILPQDTKWDTCWYLGTPENQDRVLGVLSPGRLIDLNKLFRRSGHPEPSLFTRLDSHCHIRKEGWSSATELDLNLGRGRKNYSHCIISNKRTGNKCFSLCPLNTHNKRVTLSSMIMKLNPTENDEDYYTLTRYFKFNPLQSKILPKVNEKHKWETWWINYLDNPQPIAGRIDKIKGQFHLLHQHQISDPIPP